MEKGFYFIMDPVCGFNKKAPQKRFMGMNPSSEKNAIGRGSEEDS